MGLALAFCFTACYDLDKMPEEYCLWLSAFCRAGEIRNYIDRYYNLVSVRKGSWLVVEVVLPVMMLTVIIGICCCQFAPDGINFVEQCGGFR